MIGSLGHFFHFLFNVQGLIEWGGTLLVCTIVFIETGFFVGFFLPGDSLLVTAGVFAASGQLHISQLLLLVPLCAIVGDQIGYWIGRKAGQALYRREDSLVFRKSHLERAHQFYEKYGGKTVILARFVPIIRTFCPPVAGAEQMPYARYFSYDVAGGILWGGGMGFGGGFFRWRARRRFLTRFIFRMTWPVEFCGAGAWFSVGIFWAGRSRTSAKTYITSS